jgi:hypothetical protein
MARYDVALSYAQLDVRSDAIAAGLARHGIGRGIRTVVMVRPSPEFFLLMFALFKAGAVPVLVDPGIDRRALKQCLDEAQPQAFIGIALAQVAPVAGLGEATRIVTVGAGAAGAAPRWRGWSATVPAPADAGRHRAGRGWPRSCSPAAPPRAQGRGLPAPPLRRPDPAAGQRAGMKRAAVDLPTFPPLPCSIPRWA